MKHHTSAWVLILSTPAVFGVALASGDHQLLLIALSLSVTTVLVTTVQGENMRSDARALLKKHVQPASNDNTESEHDSGSGGTVIIHGSGHTIINARTVHLGALHAQAKDETSAAE